MAFSIARGIVKAGLPLLILGLGGCTGLTHSSQPAVRTWLLRPYLPAASEAVERPDRVRVTVTTIPGLDSDRILTFSSESELNHFAAGRWADNVPELTVSLVNRTLQKSGRFEIVSPRRSGEPEDCDLHLVVDEFYATVGPSGHTSGARIAMEGRYACRGGPAANIELNSDVPVGSQSMSAIVAAFQRAVDDVMAQLLQALESRS